MATPRTVHYSRPNSGTIAGGRALFGGDAQGAGAATAELTHGVPLAGAGQGAGQGSGLLTHGVPLAAAAAAAAAVVIALAKSVPLGAAVQGKGLAAGDLSASAGGGDPVAPLSSTFTITSSAGGTNVPFALGYAFKQGEVVSGNAANGDTANWQCTILNRWPDNSVKFAILSGRKTLTAGVASTITLSSGAPTSGTALSITDLKATSITASIDCGAFGSASWATTDWDTPHKTVASGHVMSSWVYRKQIGSDTHLVGWLEVRYYLGGAVEVLPWIENCNVAPANATKSATYSFTLGGTSRYSGALDVKHHTRTPLIDGTKVSHWLGTDPGLVPLHNVEDVQATGMVPAYMAKTAAGSSRVAAQPTSFTPFQQGSHPSIIGSGGYSPSIGLLPEWDVLHLTCGNATTYRSAIWNGFSAGRYSIHYRAEADSHRPIRLSQNTTLQLSEPTDPHYHISHQPAFAFLPYLLTGWNYFAEQVQFQASANILFESPSARSNGSGIIQSSAAGSVRHAAWGWRTFVQALGVTPDSDTTMAGEYRTQLTNNVNHYHGRYIAISHNPQGWVEPYEHGDAYDDVQLTPIWFGAPWMQDFLTAVWGYTKDQGTGLDSTTAAKLDALFTWKAQSIVGRFGFTGATEYLYRDYHVYGIAMSSSNSCDWAGGTGPWYADWGAVYNATFSGAVADQMPWPSPGAKVEGNLRNLPVGVAAEFPCAEALPALAYAVKHGVTGAELAKHRLTTAANWPEFALQLDVQPVWAVTDRAWPKWWRGLAVNEWREMAGTSMPTPTREVRDTAGNSPNGSPTDSTDRLDAYCGIGQYVIRSTMYTIAAGGHGDHYGNDVCKLDLRSDVLSWAIQHAGSSGNVCWDTNGAFNGMLSTNPEALARYTDGLPCSRHTYMQTQSIERHGRMVSTGGSISKPGSGFQDVEAYRVDAAVNDNAGWDAQYSYPGAQGGTGPFRNGGSLCLIAPTTFKDPRTEVIYTIQNGTLHKLVPGASSGATWSSSALSWNSAYPWSNSAVAVDTIRGKALVALGYGENTTTTCYTIDIASLTLDAAHTYSGGSASALGALPAACGALYNPWTDQYLLRGPAAGSTVYTIHPTTFAVGTLTTTNGSGIPAQAGAGDGGVFNKFQFVPHLRGAIYFPGGALNARFLRTH